jgi:hypothetical protein
MAHEPAQGMECGADQCQLHGLRDTLGQTDPGTDPAVDGNDHAHDSITQHKCTDCHPPAETSRNH